MITGADWRQRLRSLVWSMNQGKKVVEYPLKRMVELVDAPNSAKLNEELTKLVISRELDAIYRVRSVDTGTGIAEYRNVTEIPPRVFDDSSGHYQDIVMSRDVELVYRNHK